MGIVMKFKEKFFMKEIMGLLVLALGIGHTIQAAPSLSSDEKIKILLEEIPKNISKEYSVDFEWLEKTTEKETPRKKDTTESEPIIKKKTPSQGENRVAELLRIQREKIRKKREADKQQHRSDRVANEDSSQDWMKNKIKNQNHWTDQKLKEVENWQEKKLATLNEWAQAKERYHKEIPALKKDLTDLNDFQKENKEKNDGKSKIEIEKEEKEEKEVAPLNTTPGKSLGYSLIQENFSLPIRSQGRRSTCSAFAAVRALEILMLKQGEKVDLSEQYFYFASKPQCQSSPCSKKGSWPSPAFSQSIPTESACPYSEIESRGNETQIPLPSSCNNGRVKVKEYTQVKSRIEIQNLLRQGHPVIGGFKLNEAFYKNKGHVFKYAQNAGSKNQKLDQHAQGHALLLVGVLDLPQALWSKEGRHCTLVVNSWGSGWGLGGHACISDAWFDQYRYPFNFLGVKQVSKI